MPKNIGTGQKSIGQKCDESRYQLFRNDGRAFVRRRTGDAYMEDCVDPTVKHGGGSIMVWGCMSEVGVGELKRVSGRLCAKDYVGSYI